MLAARVSAAARRHCIWPVLYLLCACADASSLPADPLPVGDASYSNTPSGFVFPAMVGHFQRLDIFRQDPKGQSVSVGYALHNPAGNLTAIVHVYPAKVGSGTLALFDSTENATSERSKPEMAVLQRELMRLHPSLRVLAQDDAFLVQEGIEESGRELVVAYDNITTVRPEPTVMDAYAFCCRGRNRAVVFRFQYPQAIATSAKDDIVTFMRDLPWAAPQHDEESHHEAPPMPR